jgi:hypothetical protein
MIAAPSTVPSASAVVDAADRGRGAAWLDRGLVIAELAGRDPDRLRGEPVGRLQGAVLTLHEALSGGELAATTVCPSCAALVEFTLPVTALRGMTGGPSNGCLDLGDTAITWRAPTAEDLRGAAGAVDPVAALRAACLAVTVAGREVAASDLPAEAVVAAEQAMAVADPLAEVLVDVACPECGASFDADVDPIGFVWAEVEALAVRLLREVDELARAYGWPEEIVLGLPAPRRAAYLAIVRGDEP